MQRSRKARGGFTLIELMVVVVIIGILAVFTLNTFVTKAEQAKVKATKGIISKIAGEVDMFKLSVGKYPQKLQDLMLKPSWAKTWEGPYVQKLEELEDAWSNKLVFRAPGTGGAKYDLISLGADGEEGGEEEDKDIWNHDLGGQ